MNRLIFFTALFVAIIITACGKAVVNSGNDSYEPKIVVEGFLVANQKVEKIRITRNFPVNTNLRKTGIIPDVSTTKVTITDMEKNRTCNLSFHVAKDGNFNDYYWYDSGNDLVIDYGKTYRLDVTATIDNHVLHASSMTTVPMMGFRISHVNFDSLIYRQHAQDSNIEYFTISIERSPGSTYYLTTIRAMNPSLDNYIYGNPYDDADRDDVADDLSDYANEYDWIQNQPRYAGQSQISISWMNLWFYDDYEVIILSGDENYSKFMQTYDDVQGMDGNFHEPKFSFQGDGIGVFASVIADTTRITVLKNYPE